MAANPGFGQRAREARRLWTVRHDEELTYARIGEMVAERTGRGDPYSHQAVRKWFVLGQEPEYQAAAALAEVLGVDPGWLAFGTGEAGATSGDEKGAPVVEAPIPMRQIDVGPKRTRKRG